MGQLASLLQAPSQSAIYAVEGLTRDEAAVWPFVRDEAAAAGVDPALVMAVIGHESEFKIRAYNPQELTGGPSTGLMQVQLPTARQVLRRAGLTIEQLFDPVTNIAAGARYLRDQLRRYRDVPTALAAYNAGTPRRTAAGGFVNQGYVDDVLRRLPRYQALLAGLPEAPTFGLGFSPGPWALVAGGGVLLLGAAVRMRQSGRRRR